ncbi:MAG TPA: hypothetical protein VM223_18160 [Planctomycetota bacterium]|nr:hypothetical protein [Planctomycetota bacterium]
MIGQREVCVPSELPAPTDVKSVGADEGRITKNDSAGSSFTV